MGHYIRDINGNYIWVDDSGKQKQVTNEGTIASNAGTKKQAIARLAASLKLKERKKAEERESFNTRNEVGKMVVTGVHLDPVTKEIITDEGFDRTRVGGGGLSGFDPLLGNLVSFYVGDKVLRGVGNLALEGLGRYGSNLGWKQGLTWARNKIISNEFKNLSMPTLTSNPRLYTTDGKGNYRLLSQFGEEIGTMRTSPKTKTSYGIDFVASKNKGKGVSEDLYNAGVSELKSLGKEGLESGHILYHPEITTRVTEKFPRVEFLPKELLIIDGKPVFAPNPNARPIRLLTGNSKKDIPTKILELTNHRIEVPVLNTNVSKGSRPLIQYGSDFLEPSEYFDIKMLKFPEYLIQDNNVEIIPFSDLHTVADYGEFTPKVKASIGKFNELYGKETVNRFRDLGYDVETPIPIIEKGSRNLRKPITAIEQNTRKPVYLGTYDEGTSVMGQYWPDLDIAIVDPTLSKNLPSVVFHERNMHGTDNIIDAFDAIGQPKAKNMYLDFLDKLFVRKVNYGDVDIVEPAPGIERVGKNSYMIDFGNGHKYPMAEGTNRWYEGRSTVNELKRKYLYDVWSNAGKPENLGDVRPQYLEKIDNLSEGELLGDLANKTNGYGLAYVALRKNNPNFIPDLKHLLKYGPMFAGAGYVSKQKQGGKFKYYIPKRATH